MELSDEAIGKLVVGCASGPQSDKIASFQTEGMDDPTPANSVKDSKPVIVHKFMVEIAIYPSGKAFPKVYPVGQTMKGMQKPKPKKGKKIETKAITEVKNKRLL